MAFMNMNLDRHRKSFHELFNLRIRGEHEKAALIREFYKEYFAIMDLSADFYLETVESVFQAHQLPKGELKFKGRLVRPEALRRTWAATPDPKWVVAVGDCACSGGEFAGSYAVVGPVAAVLPVDLELPGCPPEPLRLLQGLLALVESYTWMMCRTRRLSTGAILCLVGWLFGLLLSTALFTVSLLAALRKAGNPLPVIVATARDAVGDRPGPDGQHPRHLLRRQARRRGPLAV